ncbi:creatininase family protein [Clostridium sp. 'deep sea']|uniref:creatininase family protein n=1 Tax=Clostridium sp. 'deep sea' TaxID=2779445 RepID=UPI0018965457|nr:creatininase family protein [Clostridium sp. 'deep sea']QOR36481.1 creatininase family protein [Clostridium sp. 'deep sea']
MSKNIMQLTWQELAQINKDSAVIFVNIAPIEQHSIHLPLGVDVYETEYWQKLASKLLKEQTYEVYHLPVIPCGYATKTNIVGNLYLSKNTLFNLVYEVLNNIAQWKFKNIVLLSAHADPIHNIIMEKACDKINAENGIKAIAPMGAIFSGEKVGINSENCAEVNALLTSYPHDYHAGWIETSCMLNYNKMLVKDKYKDMPNIEIDPKHMLSKKKLNKSTGDYGHLGYPQYASTDIGRQLNEAMAKQIVKATTAFIKRDGYEKYQHHFLYSKPFVKLMV